MHMNCLCTMIGSLFSLKYLYLSHICIWTILQQNIGKIFCNSTYIFLTLSFHLRFYNILCVHLDKCNHFSSTYQILLRRILFPHLTTHHILSLPFFFHYIRQIIHCQFKDLLQSMLLYHLLHAIKTHLCSSTDSRLGYYFT